MYSGWSYRRQHNFKRWYMVVVLWWCIKNQTKRQDYCHSGGGIYLTWESRPPSCILANRALFQQRSWVQCFAHWPPARSTNGVQYLKAYGDSKLVLDQVKGEYEVRHGDLISYHRAAIQLANMLEGFYISHVSRLQTTNADALAALVATLALPADTNYCLTVATRHLFYLKYRLEVSEVHTISTNFKPRDWRFLIIDYAPHGILLDDPREAMYVRWRSTQFYYDAVVKTLSIIHTTVYFFVVYPIRKKEK